MTQSTGSKSDKLSVFISYSRKDMEFADRLEAGLRAADVEPLIDRTEIYAFEDWWKRIQALITRADTIIFVLSPDAVQSDTCRKEIDFAATLGKRFAPIVWRDVDVAEVPLALSRLNFIFFNDPTQFDLSLRRLTDGLRTNIDWVRRHTEFGLNSSKWQQARRPSGLLLRSPLLEEAEAWISARPSDGPEPTLETREYITASRRAATQRRNILTGSLGAGLVLALGLAGFAYWQRDIAETQRALARQQEQVAASERDRALNVLAGQSQLMARRSLDLARSGNIDDAISAALAALPRELDNPERPVIPAAVAALNYAIDRDRTLLVLPLDGAAGAVFSPDGERALATGYGGVRLWDANTGRVLHQTTRTGDDLEAPIARYSQDGALIAIADGSTLNLLDGKSGIEVRSLTTTGGRIRSLLFAGNGKALIASGDDNTMRAWNVDSGELLYEQKGPEPTRESPPAPRRGRSTFNFQATAIEDFQKFGAVSALFPTPDGRSLVSGGGPDRDRLADARMWDVETGQLLRQFSFVLGGREYDGRVSESKASIAPDSTRIAVVDSDGVARVWSLATGAQLFALVGGLSSDASSNLSPGSSAAVKVVRFSHDGRTIATGSADGTVRLWNAVDQRLLAVLRGHEEEVSSIEFNAKSGLLLTTSQDRTARLWSTETGELVAVLRGHEAAVAMGCFNTSGERVITAGRDGTLRIWRTQVGRPISAFTARTSSSSSRSEFSPRTIIATADGRRIFAGSPAGSYSTTATGLLIDGTTGGTIAEIEAGQAQFVAGGEALLVGNPQSDDALKLYGAADGRQRATVKTTSLEGQILSSSDTSGSRFAHSDKHKLMVFARGTRVQIVDAASGQGIADLDAGGDVRSVALVGEPPLILVAVGDGVGLYEASTGSIIRKTAAFDSGIERMLVSPDGNRMLLVMDDRQLALWSLPDLKPVAIERAAEVEPDQIAFSPDGKIVRGQTKRGALYAWNAASGARLLALDTMPDGSASELTASSKLVTFAAPAGERGTSFGNEGPKSAFASDGLISLHENGTQYRVRNGRLTETKIDRPLETTLSDMDWIAMRSSVAGGGSRLVLTNSFDVSVIDTRSGNIASHWPNSERYQYSGTTKAGALVFKRFDPYRVAVVDPVTGATQAEFVVRAPDDLSEWFVRSFDVDEGYYLLSSNRGDAIIGDLRTGRTSANLTTPADLVAFAPSEDGKGTSPAISYVGQSGVLMQMRSGEVRLVDLKSGRLVSSYRAPGGATGALDSMYCDVSLLDSNGRKLLLTSSGGAGPISVYEVKDVIGRAYDLTLYCGKSRRQIVLKHDKSKRFVLVDAANGRELAALPDPKQPMRRQSKRAEDTSDKSVALPANRYQWDGVTRSDGLFSSLGSSSSQDDEDRYLASTSDWSTILFSGDERRILFATQNGALLVVDAGTGGIVSHLEGSAERSARIVHRLFSNDGTRVVLLRENGTLGVLEADSGRTLFSRDQVTAAELLSGNERLAFGTKDGRVGVFDLVRGRQLWTQPTFDTEVTSFSVGDGGPILSTAADGSVIIQDPESGARMGQLPALSNVNSHTIIGKPGVVATSTKDGRIHLRTFDGKLLSSLFWPGIDPKSQMLTGPAVVSADGEMIIFRTTSYTGFMSQTHRWWAWNDAKRSLAELEVKGDDQEINWVFGASDRAAAILNGRRVGLFDLNSGKRIAVVPEEAAGEESTPAGGGATRDEDKPDFEFDAGGSRFIATTGGRAELRDVRTGALVASLSRQGEKVGAARFAVNGQLIAVQFTDGGVRFLRARDASLLATMSRPGENADRSYYSSSNAIHLVDGRKLALIDKDVFDLASGKPLVTGILASDERRRFLLYMREQTYDGKDSERPLEVLDAATGDVRARFFRTKPDEQGTKADIDIGAVSARTASNDYIATGEPDYAIRIWSGNDASLLAELKGHTSFVTALTFQDNGSRLASGGADKVVRWWTRDAGSDWHSETIAEVPHPPRKLAISPSGNILAALLANGEVWLWQLDTRRRVTLAASEAGPLSFIQLSPDGNRLLGESKSLAVLWDTENGTLVTSTKREDSSSDRPHFAFTTDSRYLYSGGDSYLLSTATGEMRKLDGIETGGVNDPPVTAGTKIFFSGWRRTAEVLDTRTLRVLRFGPFSQDIKRAAISPDGKLVALANNDGTISLWDADNGTKRLELGAEAAPLREASRFDLAFGFDPEGKRLFLSAGGATGFLFDAQSGRLVARIAGQGGKLEKFIFLSGGDRLITGGVGDTWFLWDAVTGERVGSFDAESWRSTEYYMSVSGPRGLVYDSSGPRLFDLATNDDVGVLRGKDDADKPLAFKSSSLSNDVTSTAIAPDGAYVAVGVGNGEIEVWRLADEAMAGRLQADATGIRSVRFVAPERLIVQREEGKPQLWSILPLGKLAELGSDDRRIDQIVVGTASGRIVTMTAPPTTDAGARESIPGQVELWDADTGRRIARLGNTTYSTKVHFTKGDAQVIVSGLDAAGELIVFSAIDGSVEFRLPRPTNRSIEAVSPSGRYIVEKTYSDRDATLVDLFEDAASTLSVGQSGSLTAVSFSDDETLLVTGATNGQVRVYDLRMQQLVLEREGPSSGVLHVQIIPDRHNMIALYRDGSVRVWELAPGAFKTQPTDRQLIEYASILNLPESDAATTAPAAKSETKVSRRSTTTSEAMQDCDRLATDPLDPLRRGPGVAIARIRTAMALPACETAIKAQPNERRYLHQLARTMEAAGRFEDSRKLLERAAEAGYAASELAFGRKLLTGATGVTLTGQTSRGYTLLGAAAAKGDLTAAALLAARDWTLASSDSERTNARSRLQELASQNGHQAHLELAHILEQEADTLDNAIARLGHLMRALSLLGEGGEPAQMLRLRQSVKALSLRLGPEATLAEARKVNQASLSR